MWECGHDHEREHEQVNGTHPQNLDFIVCDNLLRSKAFFKLWITWSETVTRIELYVVQSAADV